MFVTTALVYTILLDSLNLNSCCPFNRCHFILLTFSLKSVLLFANIHHETEKTFFFILQLMSPSQCCVWLKVSVCISNPSNLFGKFDIVTSEKLYSPKHKYSKSRLNCSFLYHNPYRCLFHKILPNITYFLNVKLNKFTKIYCDMPPS